MKKNLIIKGMSCQNCVNHVQKALSNVIGVTGARVDLSDGTAEVDGTADLAELIKAVADEGYEARIVA